MPLGSPQPVSPEAPKPQPPVDLEAQDPIDQEKVGAHNWPSGSDTESNTWGRIAILACLALSVVFVALLAYMARGRWPSKELLERCNDPNYHGHECADVEGRSSGQP